MRVLWITNSPIAKHRDMLGGAAIGQSGGWMVTSYAALQNVDELTLGVATSYNGDAIKKEYDDKNVFYLVPLIGDRAKDISSDEKNLRYWRKVIEDFRPDVIHLWGTEFSHGLCALKAARDTPSVAYIQGLMSQISYHFLAQISLEDQIKSTTLRDIYLRQCYWDQVKKQENRAKIEQEILKRVKAVIVENEWCANNCRLTNRNLKVYKSLLPINPIFAEYDWDISSIKRHSIFTVAGNYPHKGFHMLLRSLAIVVKYYPDTVVYIPGAVTRSNQRSSYHKYTQSLINKYGLTSNLQYLGKLTPEDMAKQMKSCNVFVLPSSIENHSSTLIEAMMVGAPSVASCVGGVSEYLKNGENGFLYRFEEYQTAATLIMDVFENDRLAVEVSKEAMFRTRKDRLSIDLKKDFITCYKALRTI
jgi:glycosyltransferase involved in cell wall biosynthesis